MIKTVGLSKNEIIDFANKSYSLKPKDVLCNELVWKTLCLNILTGRNTLLQGESGCGKTTILNSLSSVFPDRSFPLPFTLGGTQDARSSLSGNIQVVENETRFVLSEFAKQIQIANSIIRLEELSRASKDAWNILIHVLDKSQRVLKLDESFDVKEISVADGVCFIATTNQGIKYTSTARLDNALIASHRFPSILNIETLNLIDETSLAMLRFPDVDKNLIAQICDFAISTRDTDLLSQYVTTGNIHELLFFIDYGYSFQDAFKIVIDGIYKTNPEDHNYIKKLIQKYNL